MASMVEIVCKCGCGRKRMVRTADVKRGWGKFFSKSCKAKHQENRTGQYKKYLRERADREDSEEFTGGGFDNTAHQNNE